MYYDLLLHIDLYDTQRLDIALSNITNYLSALPDEKYSFILLANSGAVQLLTKIHINYFEKFQPLVDKGVLFRVCQCNEKVWYNNRRFISFLHSYSCWYC